MLKRVQREFEDFTRNPPKWAAVRPASADDITKWRIVILGPDGTPYEGGLFFVFVSFPTDYPFKPPSVQFETRIYHPNISVNGGICLAALKDKWSPVHTISKIIRRVIDMLCVPDPYDALCPAAADLYLKDRHEFEAVARAMTHDHAQ